MESPLEGWIAGKQKLPSRFYAGKAPDNITQNTLCWVSPEKRVPLHLAGTLNWLSLAESRSATRDFLRKAYKIVLTEKGDPLEHEDRWDLEDAGLKPPSLCFPIYLITCEDMANQTAPETVMYVGQTKVSNRFAGGHNAALKLHDPKYAGFRKWVYQCSVCFSNDEYIFLEWIYPPRTAQMILDDVESILIFALQPELNSAKRKRFASKTPLSIQLQKMLPESRLPDQALYSPLAEKPLAVQNTKGLVQIAS
jgi:hypothetical protein